MTPKGCAVLNKTRVGLITFYAAGMYFGDLLPPKPEKRARERSGGGKRFPVQSTHKDADGNTVQNTGHRGCVGCLTICHFLEVFEAFIATGSVLYVALEREHGGPKKKLEVRLTGKGNMTGEDLLTGLRRLRANHLIVVQVWVNPTDDGDAANVVIHLNGPENVRAPLQKEANHPILLTKEGGEDGLYISGRLA